MTLDELALQHGTDKASNHHNYTPIYERHFAPMRQQSLVILEIGVGGDEHPDRGGQSLRMWRDYFPNSRIIGVDLHHKRLPLGEKIMVFKASQTDENALQLINQRVGPVDIIIDDASHHNALTPRTFEIMFPLLRPGGLYFVEDVHTTYWKEHFDGNSNPLAQHTIMGYFQQLTHQLNNEGLPEQYRNQFYGTIEYITFYPQLILIKKL